MNKTKNPSEEKTPELFMELARQNKLQLLEGIFDHKYGIKSIKDTGLIEFVNATYPAEWGLLKEDFYDLIITGKEISDETYEYLVSPLSDKDKNRWIYGIPYLIHSALKNNNKEKLNGLLKITKENNRMAMSHPREIPDKYGHYGSKLPTVQETQSMRNQQSKFLFLGLYGVIPILKMTIDLAFDKGDIDLAKELLNINEALRVEKVHVFNSEDTTTAPSPFSYLYVCTPYEFKCEVIKRDTKMPEIKKHIEYAIHDGILNVDELIYTEIKKIKDSNYSTTSKVEKVRGPVVRDNLSKIYAAIRKYPICDIEYWLDLVNKGEWDELKKCITDSSKNLRKEDVEKFVHAIDEKNVNAFTEQLTRLYDSHMQYYKKEDIVYKTDDNNDYFPKRKDKETLNQLFKRIKESIIGSIDLEESTSNRLNSFDKEYFENLLKVKNYRDLLIDLCVRLETVLEDVYDYGDEDMSLSELVDEASTNGSHHIPQNMNALIHKLIRCRNNEVHRRVDNEMLTSTELQKCIDFICSMK